ncbi:MAG: TfuA-like protein [Candidatus Acidiferrales bacterium]
MSIYVFVGPTLPVQEARMELDAIYLPPASQGDVFRVTRKKPKAIGIIDGYFESVRSVVHKEILWAMSQGIPVYGSASMGALRAAELAAYGMRGVGKVFEAYRDGEIEDDDEVAVGHGPAEYHFLPVTDSMVNIRATLAAAERDSIIPRATRTELERIAKATFYKERGYALILQLGSETGLRAGEIEALREWLPHGQVDQKREDALEMLRLIRTEAPDKRKSSPICEFENSLTWQRILRGWRQPPRRTRSRRRAMPRRAKSTH